MGEEALDTGIEFDGPDESPEGDEQLHAVTVSKAAQPVGDDAQPGSGGQQDAPAETEAKKIPPLTPEQQEAVNEAIGKKVAKQREAERQAQEIQQQLAEAQRRLQQYEAPVRPDIPPPPDPYEDDFAAKVAHRDAMIAKAAQYDGQIAWQRQQEEQLREQAAAAERERVRTMVNTYSETANKLGITADELKIAGAQIAPLMPDRLAMRILNDEQGPEITVWLARNIAEADKMAHMSPEDAAVYLATVVKPKAKRAPPKLAPEPADRLTGASMKESGRGPRGAQYF